jgi:hypothetical protein
MAEIRHFVLAVLLASALGAIVQTQFNLARILALGAPITWRERIDTTLFDIGSFGPTLAAITAVTFLIALPVAGVLAHVLPGLRGVLFFAAGFLGIWVALRTVDALVPPPTLIAATRGVFGLLAMMAAAGLGSWLFSRRVWKGRHHGRSR